MKRLSQILKVFVLIAIITAFISFAYLHMYDVNIYLLFATYKVPLFVVMLSIAFISFIIPLFYFSFKERSNRANLEDIKHLASLIILGKKSDLKDFLIKKQDINPRYIFYLGAFFSDIDYFKDILEKDFSLKKDPINAYLLSSLKRKENKEDAIKIIDEFFEKQKPVYEIVLLKRNILYEIDPLKAFDIQKDVLKLSNKKQRQKEENIYYALRVFKSLNEDDKLKLKELEESFEEFNHPFTAFFYLYSLSSQNKTKDVQRVWQALDERFKDYIGAIALSYIESSVYLLSFFESDDSFSKDILSLIYIKLGIFSKLSSIEENVSSLIVKTLDKLYLENSKDICKSSLEDVIFVWKCSSCGKLHKNYTLKCSCDEWFSLELYLDTCK